MQKKYKKLTACALVTMLCLSATMPYPVHATGIDQNADTGETQELDENAVSIGDTDTVENETNVQETENNPEPERNLTKENEFSDDMGGTAATQDKSENVLGSEPVMAVSDNVQPMAANNAGSFNVTGGSSGSDWVYDNSANTLTFENSGNYTVTGDGAKSAEQIVIGANINVIITLNNVNCQPAYAGMNIDGSSNVTLVLVGSNTFIAGNNFNAGIEFNNAIGSLIIKGSGSLTATGGRWSSGIGGGADSSGNNITVDGGVINANGGTHGAGIGGGTAWGNGENITINGGTVTAISAGFGAGIGGGNGNTLGKNIRINGGTVIASSLSAVGIGGPAGSINIFITGGSVKANGPNGNISSIPEDGRGHNVYLAKLENQSGVNEITIDSSTTIKRNGDNPDGDTAFYLYLAGGQNHDLLANGLQYKAIWNDNSTFTVKQIPPVPSVDIDSQTSSTITVKEPAGAGTYGNAQYRIAGGSWQDSNVLTGLESDTPYTIEVRYAGNTSFTESDIGKKEDVNTAPATYTITIPQETLTAGNESSKNEMSVDTNNFDLGYGGKVDVKVSNTGSISSDGKLTLTRQQATETITSALLVDGSSFTDINNPVATFTMDNKDSEKVSISFAAPTETKILAGTYSGTVTFEVSYSEP